MRVALAYIKWLSPKTNPDMFQQHKLKIAHCGLNTAARFIKNLQITVIYLKIKISSFLFKSMAYSAEIRSSLGGQPQDLRAENGECPINSHKIVRVAVQCHLPGKRRNKSFSLKSHGVNLLFRNQIEFLR